MKNKKIYAEGMWVLGAQIVAALGSLALIRVSTEFLEPTSYGQLSILLTITFLVSQVAIGGINVGVSRYYTIADEIGDLKGYLKTVYKNILVVNILLMTAAVMVILISEIYFESKEIKTIALATELGFVASSNSILSGLFNSARERKLAAFGTTGEIIVRIVTIIIVTRYSELNINKMLGCYFIASIVIMIIQCGWLIKLVKKASGCKNSSKNWNAEIIKFALPFAPWNLATWIQQSTDRWSLSYFVDYKTAGIYSALFQVGYSSIMMLFSVGLKLIQPILYQRVDRSVKEKNSKEANLITKKAEMFAILTGLFALSVTIFFHREIFTITVASEYIKYSNYLPWITLAAMLYGASEIYLTKMQAQLMTHRLSKVKTSLGIVGMIISIVGAKIAGLDGVIFGMIIFSLISIVAMKYFSYER